MIKTYAYKDMKIDEIFAREEEKSTVEDVVAEIIADVRKNGDAALKAYCEKFLLLIWENWTLLCWAALTILS